MDLSSLPLLPTSAGALLGVVVLMVLRGYLIPRAVVDDVRADRDMWKAAYENERARTGELSGQVTTLMEVARTAEHVMRSLPAAAASGGSDETVSS